MGSKTTFQLTMLGLNDIRRSLDYILYELKNEPASRKLKADIDEAIAKICLFPNIGEKVKNEFIKKDYLQKVLVHSYYLYYVYDTEKDVVVIMRFYHNSRNTNEMI